jgi:hypothetical protein
MATPQRKNSWSFLWPKSSPPPSICSPTEEMFRAEETNTQEMQRDPWERVRSANQRRYAEYVATSFNLDVSYVQPR